MKTHHHHVQPSLGRRLARIASATTLALLGLGGCGDDAAADDAADSGSTTSSTPGTDTGTTPPASESSGDTGPEGTTIGGSTSAVDSSSGSGDEPTGSTSGETGLEITGVWLEDFGGGDVITHDIDERSWSQVGPFGRSQYHVDAFDNEARWIVAQGDAANEFFPDLYSKFDWAWDGDVLYYCTSVFDAATAEEASAAPSGDDTDLVAGCGGFPWSPLTPAG